MTSKQKQNASCPACGLAFTETHWALHQMGNGYGPVFGVCPNDCDEHTQQIAYEDYCQAHNLDYATGGPT